MPSALVHYFSGTGNTARAAKLVGEKLEKNGYKVELKNVDYKTVPFTNSYDLHIIAFPVYACAPPFIMQKYIKSLPHVPNVKTAIIAIHGEVNIKGTIPGYAGQAPMQASRMLKRRGYDVFLTDTVGFPVNITQGMNPPDIEDQQKLLELAEKKIDNISDRIAALETSFKKCNMLNIMWSWFFGLLYSNFGKFFISKLYIADSKCNACKKCVNSCPAGAIRLSRQHPRWGYNCEGCQRCINICPQKAIQTSAVRLIVVILAFFLPYDIIISNLLGIDYIYALGQIIGTLFGASLWITGYAITIYIFDKLAFLLEQIPGIRKVFELNFTKYFRRYLEPHFKP